MEIISLSRDYTNALICLYVLYRYYFFLYLYELFLFSFYIKSRCMRQILHGNKTSCYSYYIVIRNRVTCIITNFKCKMKL